MKWFVTAALALACLPVPALAYSPSDFEGQWRVSRMVGASDAGPGQDFHKLLGTNVTWGKDAVQDANGVCRLVHPTVSPLPNDSLQHDLWGGQTIGGLDLPKTAIAHAFGRNETPVFDDGGKGCARAVMLKQGQMLLMFSNGYLYLLDRVARAPSGQGS